jgi:hypothetical protein
MAGGPLDGSALVLAAAKASVSGERLPDLADRAQGLLGPRLPEYGRRYECAHEDESQAVFFVDAGYWVNLGEEMALDERESQALRRAHAAHLRKLGDDLDRSEEFETALDLREVVVIGKLRD